MTNEPAPQRPATGQPGDHDAAGGAPMDAAALEESRKVLEAHLTRTETELDERLRAATPSGERPGFGKRAGDYVAQVVEDRTNNQLVDTLAVTATAIRRALVLIDEGGYGRCLSCGDAIGGDRLRAVPWAVLCMGCQSEGEHGTGPLGVKRPKR